MTVKNIPSILPTSNSRKRNANVCIRCAPPDIDFINIFDGYCEKCGKKAMLVTIKNDSDEIGQKYYNDIGGEG